MSSNIFIIDMQLDKIKQYEEFISLYLRRESTLPILHKLHPKTEMVRALQLESHKVLANSRQERLNKLRRRMQLQQLTIVNILLELNKQGAQMKKFSTTLGISKLCLSASKGNRSAMKDGLGIMNVAEKFLKGTTPKLYLDDYQQSPFVRRTKPVPVPFQFLDFEVTITSEMFEKIPKYMRGRDTVDELSNFLETIIIPCFNEKYQLIHRQKDCIRNRNELEMWKLYKDQSNYFPAQKFITQGDITRKLKKMIDKKTQNKISMLKQLRILQEQRQTQVICYIWAINNV